MNVLRHSIACMVNATLQYVVASMCNHTEKIFRTLWQQHRVEHVYDGVARLEVGRRRCSRIHVAHEAQHACIVHGSTDMTGNLETWTIEAGDECGWHQLQMHSLHWSSRGH